MRRRLIKQAGQAYTITLPIEWIRKNGLEKSGEVELDINEKSITIKTDSRAFGKKEKIDITGMNKRMIYQSLCASYVKGTDEIEILSKEDFSGNINEMISNLLGFALVEQNKNKYIIKDLNFGDYPHLDEIFKRVFQMILLFYESAIRDVFGRQEEKIEGLKARDIEVNKFCLYLQRAINKSSYPDLLKGRALFSYSFELEKISDEIERFWRTNVKYSPKKNEDIKKLANLSFRGLELAFDALYNINKNALSEIYIIREKIRDKSMQIKINDSNSIRLIRHIVKICEEAADLNHLTLLVRD
jgi:phosphate uptake regulator